jgi:hypothetical protein
MEASRFGTHTGMPTHQRPAPAFVYTRREAEERYLMSKKIMLFALAVVSAAVFAMPSMAPAFENHIEGATGKSFTGTGAGGILTAANEPTISCTGTTASGSFTSETTGNVSLVFETCSSTILGVSLHCRSTDGATGQIRVSLVFHLITLTNAKGENKSGILLTPPFPTIICGEGFSERKFQFTGNGLIGTITTPACGASSATMTIDFSGSAGNQEHKLYTGSTYDLTLVTEPDPGGTVNTFAFNGDTTLNFTDGVSRRLVCT